jgi:hypothetical protein
MVSTQQLDVMSEVLDPETLYTKQNCIGMTAAGTV